MASKFRQVMSKKSRVRIYLDPSAQNALNVKSILTKLLKNLKEESEFVIEADASAIVTMQLRAWAAVLTIVEI